MAHLKATYRVQLREHIDFAGVAQIAAYLARLGASHLYLSPIFAATAGSTHGYDAIDFNVIEPALGGAAQFRSLHERLAAEGLRLIVDFVPNHMAATPPNGWWRDVLEWGAASPYAAHFDVDWSAPKLLVPVLGAHYGNILDKGDLQLAYDSTGGSFSLRYFAIELPLTPPSYAMLLARVDGDNVIELARRFATATPDTAGSLKQELAQTLPAAQEASVAAMLANLQRDASAMHELHEAQAWRLAHWRMSRESLTYRRFFEIADLVGVRVENPRVFDDVHRCVLALIAEGLVHGLRIDHVDGLADPLGYLKRLESAVGQDAFYVVVEKILGADEELRGDWPVAGTTGYEFIGALANLFTQGENAEALSRAYASFTGVEADYGGVVTALKRRTLTRNLAGELDVLTSQAHALAQGDIHTRDFGADTLRRAIIELASSLPVYRTYIDAAGPRAEDDTLLARAADLAKSSREVEDESAIDFIVKLLRLDLPTPDAQATALNFAVRLQQTTGPLMAKALEDTLFYRYNRLIALNEVGGEPAGRSSGVSGFHAAMEARLRSQPQGLSTTSTHDTKRGEDARARIYVISEAPEAWAEAATRWSQMNAPHRRDLSAGPAPEPEMEWFFYQSLLGAWPATLELRDADGLRALKARMLALMQKATREAKLRTSWTQPDEEYEQALSDFGAATLDPARSDVFLRDFASFIRPLIVTGASNSLTQTLLKLVSPGVPDIYQGTELWDLSLVDPDNRRKIDFVARQHSLENVRRRPVADLVAEWRAATLKLRLLVDGLALRRALDGWERAAYIPLEVSGPAAAQLVALARSFDDDVVIAVGVRCAYGLLRDQDAPHVPVGLWRQTGIVVPPRFAGARLFDVVTREEVPATGSLPASTLLRQFPVALLSTRRIE